MKISKIRKIWSGPGIATRLTKASFWSMIGFFSLKGFEILAFIFIARFLKEEKFGELGMIQSTIGVFRIFAWVWLGTTATRFISRYRETDEIKTARIISLNYVVGVVSGIIMGISLYYMAPWISVKLIPGSHLVPLLRISSFLLVFGSIAGVQQGILSGFEEFKTISIGNGITGLLTLPIMIWGGIWYGLTGVIWALVFLQILNILINSYFLRKTFKRQKIRLGFKNLTSELGMLWGFSLPNLIGGSIVPIAVWVCSILLVNQVNGYFQMGLFNAGFQWRNAIIFFPTALGNAMLPILSNLYGVNDFDGFKKILRFNLFLNIVLTGVVALFLILISSPILRSYGPGFIEGRKCFIALMLSAVFASGGTIIGQGIASLNRMWGGTVLNIFWAGMLLLLAKSFIRYGASGLGVAFLGAYIFNLIINGLYLKNLTDRMDGRPSEGLVLNAGVSP